MDTTSCLEARARRAPFSCPDTAAQHHFHNLSISGASVWVSLISQRCCETAVSGVKLSAWQDTAGKWSSVLQRGSPLGRAIRFPSPQPTFPGAPRVRREAGARHSHADPCLEKLKGSVSETPPTPQSPRAITGAAQTGGKRRSSTKIVLPREARRETKACEKVITLTSRARSLPDSNAARQSHSAPVLCRGNWAHGWREAPLLAGALAAEGAADALCPTAMRAEPLLGQRGGKGACSEGRGLHWRG